MYQHLENFAMNFLQADKITQNKIMAFQLENDLLLIESFSIALFEKRLARVKMMNKFQWYKLRFYDLSS